MPEIIEIAQSLLQVKHYKNASNFISDQSTMIDAATANVRDHIEKVVESLVGDNLDSINIIKLSENQNCKHVICIIRGGSGLILI